MNCTECESQLLDLLEEELPEAEAGPIRAHLAECPACRTAMDRLESGHQLARLLPQEDPAPEVSARVQQAARAAVASPGELPSERAASGADGWKALLERLRRLALGPQVAMATVMLLVVAIGLWYLPDLRTRPGVEGEPVIHPSSEGEAAPSAAAEPAESADPLAGTAPEGSDGEEAARAGDAPEGEPAPQAQLSPAERRARLQRRRKAKREDDSAHTAPQKEALAMRDTEEGAGASGAGAGAAGSADSPVRKRAAREPSSAAATDQAAGAEAEAAPAAPDEQTAEAPIPDVLKSARKARASGRCREAVRDYERFLSGHPRHPARFRAMVEAAGCYARLGRHDRARRWLVAARENPETAAMARRHLQRLDAREAASATEAAEIEAAPSE